MSIVDPAVPNWRRGLIACLAFAAIVASSDVSCAQQDDAAQLLELRGALRSCLERNDPLQRSDCYDERTTRFANDPRRFWRHMRGDLRRQNGVIVLRDLLRGEIAVGPSGLLLPMRRDAGTAKVGDYLQVVLRPSTVSGSAFKDHPTLIRFFCAEPERYSIVYFVIHDVRGISARSWSVSSDDGSTIDASWAEPSPESRETERAQSGKLLASAPHAGRFARWVMSRNTLHVRVEMVDGPNEAIFDLRYAREALQPLLAKCRW